MIKKLVKDSFSSGMVPLLKTCITFIMAPLIVHALGNYDYGISEIVFSVVGYMGILDLGLMPAIVRYVARYHALGDKDELQRIYSSALAFLFPVGLLLSLGLVASSFWAPQLFSGADTASHQKYALFLIIVGVQVFFTFVGSIFDCYLEGLQRYTLRNYLTIVFSIAGACVLYPLLKNGGGLLAVAVVNGVGFSLKNLIYGIVLWGPKYGGYRFSRDNVSRKTFKELFSFGFKSFVYAVSLRISSLTDSLVIGAALGAAFVPFYVIPMSFLNHVRNLIWAMTRNFMPAFSELDAVADPEKVRAMFFGCSRYAVGVILPIIGGVCILGPTFLSHWMGKEYAEKGSVVLYLIACAYLVQWLNPFSNRYLTAVGKHGVMAKLGIAGSLLNLGLSIVLVKFLGIEGVALGTLLPVLAFEPYLLHKTCQQLGCSIGEYVVKVLVPLLLPALFFVLTLQGAQSLLPASSLVDVIMLGTIGMAVYSLFFVAIGMKRDERQRVYGQIRSKVYSGT